MKLSPKVLILGGHCKVALLLTPLLLARGFDVISLTNSPVHRDDILDLRKGSKGGNVEVLVTDLKHINTADSARALLDSVDPNYIIWTAGEFVRDLSERRLNLRTRHRVQRWLPKIDRLRRIANRRQTNDSRLI